MSANACSRHAAKPASKNPRLSAHSSKRSAIASRPTADYGSRSALKLPAKTPAHRQIPGFFPLLTEISPCLPPHSQRSETSLTNPEMPATIVRAGNVRIAVHKNGGRFAVAWRPFPGAPRQRETFPRRCDALTRAREIANAIANGQADAVTLTAATRDDYRLAIQALAPLGIPLHTAIEEYISARALIPGHTLHEAARALHAARPGACPPTIEITSTLIATLRHNAIRPRSAAYLKAIVPRLEKIATAFPTLPAVTPAALEEFLTARTWKGHAASPKTYNHYRAAFAMLWRYAANRGHHLPASPLPSIPILSAPGKREIYTVTELRLILAHAAPEWIPFIALGAFAGLRTCEIHRLEWQDVIFEHDEIRISEFVAGKRGTPRNVPITPPLRAWLSPCAKELGRIYPGKSISFEIRLRDNLRRALESDIPGFKWRANALRHSFGSYHVATHRNLELTRTIMGTSPAMLRHHSNNPQFRTAGAEYWKLLPDPARKIVQLR